MGWATPLKTPHTPVIKGHKINCQSHPAALDTLHNTIVHTSEPPLDERHLSNPLQHGLHSSHTHMMHAPTTPAAMFWWNLEPSRGPSNKTSARFLNTISHHAKLVSASAGKQRVFIERITSSGFERTNGNLSRKIDLGIRVEKIQRAPVRWIIVELLDNPHLADSRGVTSLSRPLPINAINVSGH